MGLIFNKQQSTGQKIGAALVFMFLGLGICGLVSDLLVYDEVARTMGYAGLATCCPVLAYFFFKLANKDFRANIWMLSGRYAVAKTAVAFLVGVPLIFHIAFTKGVPSVYHFVWSEPGSIAVTVDHTTVSCGGRYNIGLSKGVSLIEYSYFMCDTVCDVPRPLWEKLKKGDRLLLAGTRSMVGFHAHSIEQVARPRTL